jgi:hypothetical protein
VDACYLKQSFAKQKFLIRAHETNECFEYSVTKLAGCATWKWAAHHCANKIRFCKNFYFASLCSLVVMTYFLKGFIHLRRTTYKAISRCPRVGTERLRALCLLPRTIVLPDIFWRRQAGKSRLVRSQVNREDAILVSSYSTPRIKLIAGWHRNGHFSIHCLFLAISITVSHITWWRHLRWWRRWDDQARFHILFLFSIREQTSRAQIRAINQTI